MGLNIDNLMPIAKPVTDVATNAMDNLRQVKVSNNERDVNFDNNQLAAYQTTSNNNLAAFMGALNTGLSIINGLFSVVNTAIQAYAQIQESREQTRRVEIQANAYIASKREETKQIQITQEQETTRYLANLKTDLEKQRMAFQTELRKFELELGERRAAREFSQEQWRSKIKMFESLFNPVLEQAKDLRKKFKESNFTDKEILATINQIDDKLFAYAMQLNELYK